MDFFLFILKNLLSIVLLVLIFIKGGSTEEKLWWIAILIANCILTYYIYLNNAFACEYRNTLESLHTALRIIFLLLLFKSTLQTRTI